MNAIECQEAKDILDLATLGGLTPEEQAAIDEHLQACSACRRQAEEWKSLVSDVQGALKAMRNRDEPPEALRRRLVAEIAAARKWRERTARRSVWLRVAAVLLIGIGAVVTAASWWNEHRSSSDNVVVQWQRPASSPVSALRSRYPVLSGHAVLAVQRRNGEDCVSAVDKRTGKPIWDVSF